MPCFFTKVDGKNVINPEYKNNSEDVVKADLKFGTQVEPEVINKLKRYFKEDIKRMPEGCYWDAESDTARYEIKTRRFSSNAFTTTYIPNSKFWSKANGKELRLVFNFDDGLFFINYNQSDFEKYEEGFVEYDRCRGGVYKKTSELHTFIEVSDLRCISVKV